MTVYFLMQKEPMVLEVKTVVALRCVVWQKGIGKGFWDAGKVLVLSEVPK